MKVGLVEELEGFGDSLIGVINEVIILIDMG